MSAPEWWVAARPALLVAVAGIGGLYANVKALHEIRKTRLDIERAKLDMEKLRGDLADRESRIVKPTDEQLVEILLRQRVFDEGRAPRKDGANGGELKLTHSYVFFVWAGLFSLSAVGAFQVIQWLVHLLQRAH